MSDQAKVLRGLMERRLVPEARVKPRQKRAIQTIAVTSGKGGVGKSNIALNLAIALARLDSSVCLLDANLGLGNIDLMCGLNGYWNLSHVVSGARTLKDIVLHGPERISVIPGASGLIDLADCPEAAQRDIIRQLEELEYQHDFLIIDTGTGIHRSVRQFIAPADIVLVMTTPEPTSIADAYATIKALSAGETGQLETLVNQVESAQQARAITARLQQTSKMFLHIDIESAGYIPHDLAVPRAVASRKPFMVVNPHSPAARAIQQLADRLKNRVEGEPGPGQFFTRLWGRLIARAA